MEKLRQDKVMYRINTYSEKPKIGAIFRFKPNLLQRIFGYNKVKSLMLLEDCTFGNDLIKVTVPKGSVYIDTAYGALVSECRVIE